MTISALPLGIKLGEKIGITLVTGLGNKLGTGLRLTSLGTGLGPQMGHGSFDGVGWNSYLGESDGI